jgi:hypothetical protein
MSTRKKPRNFIGRLSRKIWRFFNTLTKAFITWFLRNVLVVQRRARLSQTGFVLPTVVMMVLVVTLLTTAILLRSFDRTKNASNYRVDETVLNAATPALDRARAKLNRLFSSEETRLKGNTPPDDNIAEVLEDGAYTFGDEVQLKLVKDLDGNGLQPDETDERLKSAWMFPVDTDNNGKFDSFTLYGIYYRTPPTSTNPGDNRVRGPLEARARPQFTGGLGCGAGSGDPNAGGGDSDNGWFSISGQLKKAFFTYVATVPISQEQFTQLQGSGYKTITDINNKFETHKGSKGFSALEMQQDQVRLALDNNAVFYEDDLIITDVPRQGFRLNGRVQVNGNLMLASGNVADTGDIVFYQVSSPWSCFYTAENSKIVVAGNVSANGLSGNTDRPNLGNDKVKVHFFKQREQPFNPNDAGNSAVVNNTNVTTTDLPKQMAYNTRAYAQRLNVLVQGGMNQYDAVNANQAPTPALVQNVTTFPPEISKNFAKKYRVGLSEDDARNLLQQVIEVYMKERIRRVPFAEIPISEPPQKALEVGGAPVTANTVFAGLAQIKPPDEWRPIEPGFTNVNLKYNGQTMELEQTNPRDIPPAGTEFNVGDRILVGNGLPTVWLKDGADSKPREAQPVTNGGNPINWNNRNGGADGTQRERTSQSKILDDLGDTSRGGFWERAAADPANVPGDEELAGGLRIVTGAGIYVDDRAIIGGGTGTRRDPSNAGPRRTSERSFLPKPYAALPPDQLLAKLHALNSEIPATPRPLQPISVVWPDTMPMYLWEDKAPLGVYNLGLNRDVYKGDLQMRATVVYHYNSPTPDEPIACISSYYDPTNPTTAKNSITDDPINGNALGVSNNGLNYQPPTAAQRVISPRLRRQAYMVFPDGRWANEPLKKAVQALQRGIPLSLEQKGAIDAANCALGILDGTLARQPSSDVPDNAIRERAFLDARQVKTLHKPDVEFSADGFTFDPANPVIDRQTTLTNADGKVLIADPEQMKIATQATLKSPPATKTFTPTPAEYSLPIEQRQPLEVRVTEIDVEQLRTTRFGTVNGKDEYLLPNSGIIYATRDDALPDITDINIAGRFRRDGGGSATDFKVDPGRHPNGIRLWSSGDNGGRLSRGTTNVDRPEEKGLILASNLPVYIKGDFNLHYRFGSTAPTEEFQARLAADYSNFYDRRPPRDRNFACRQKAGTLCNQGDQWRAARILADAVTLLSNNFRDGFRDEGDYDLNNNAGNMAVAARLKNGFWWNGFATNDLYRDNAGAAITPQYPINAVFPEQDAVNPEPEINGSSYVMNGVTPIQRRVNGFPEYQMEVCKKLPVSECGPQDWLRQTAAATPVAGTTAPFEPGNPWRRIAPEYSRADYPRRVAFERDQFGQLILDNIASSRFVATPIGIRGGTAQPIRYSQPAVANNPTTANNALWFWTSTANNRPNVPIAPGGLLTGFDYNSEAANSRLYYLPDDPETVPTERQMLLPGTPKFPPELGVPALAGMSVLNGNTPNDPSDFSVCIRNFTSKSYTVDSFPVGATCPAQNLIEQMRVALSTLPNDLTKFTQVTPLTIPPISNPVPLPATTKVNVFEIQGAPNLANLQFQFQRNNQTDPIFVIRVRAGVLQPLTFNNVTLQLDGVDPNNIFWVSNTGIRVQDSASQLVGNFLGGVGRVTITDGAAIKGGRFLGFRLGGSAITGNPMTTLVTTNQPLLVPVLQLHSPEGIPSDNPSEAFRSSSRSPVDRKWLQKATATNYNASLIMGDTPARPFTGPGIQGGEDGGGLHNFPRFIENWSGVPATFKGSLIQYIKSKYATAPFETVDLVNQDNSLFFDDTGGDRPAYIAGSNPDVDTLGYQYSEAAADQKAAYYQPPIRNWGYDVGLLSQTPDLFSRRFALPEAGTPNEFFRAVPKDDEWVKGLLCAAKGTGSNYQWAIADPTQRPANCPPLAQFND